jgi:Protein of unknown function (DUF3618)
MTYSEQLERQTQSCRNELAQTLEELRARMTPGEVVDQLVDYAQDTTGGLFFEHLKAASRKQPTARYCHGSRLRVAHVREGCERLETATKHGFCG